MENTLYVIAMEKEAKDISEKLGLIEIQEEKLKDLKIYRREKTSLLVTGIGKQFVAINLTRYLENCPKDELPKQIINIGYVGSTNTQIGTWVNVDKVYNYEWNIPGEEKYEIKQLENYINKDILKTIENKEIIKLPCYSAESFVTKTDIREDVIFDMELYSIYMVCQMYNIKLVSLKKVSDNLNLDSYYENLNIKNIMELGSALEIIDEMYR